MVLRPVYGLIFLFKYVGHGMELGDPLGAGPDDGIGVFFAQQIINNACATQAGCLTFCMRPRKRDPLSCFISLGRWRAARRLDVC